MKDVRIILIGTAAAAAVVSLVNAPAFPHHPAVVHAEAFYDPDLPAQGIQEAVDSLPEQGGRVVLEARAYVLRAAIVLRDDVSLSGQGPLTVLRRGPEIIHRLARDAVQGENAVTLVSAEGLRTGDRLAIRDDRFRGWFMTQAVIEALDGDTVHLDVPLIRPYAVADNAVAFNHHPMVEVRRIWDHRRHTKRFVIEDITIDGNLEENPTPISEWATAAIHLASAAEAVVQRCVVRNWVTDGIADQYGRFNTIRENVVENCRGNGFHPGTSVHGSRFINNVARGNQGDGFFFCAEVTGIQVVNNTFAGNGRNGIGDLGGSGDTMNVVSGNICYDNGRHGIHAANGGRNSIRGNVCYNNSRSEPGRFAGIALENTTDTVVSANICGSKLSGNDTASQGYGIVELGASNRNVILGNVLGDHIEDDLVVLGADTVERDNVRRPADGAAE